MPQLRSVCYTVMKDLLFLPLTFITAAHGDQNTRCPCVMGRCHLCAGLLGGARGSVRPPMRGASHSNFLPGPVLSGLTVPSGSHGPFLCGLSNFLHFRISSSTSTQKEKRGKRKHCSFYDSSTVLTCVSCILSEMVLLHVLEHLVCSWPENYLLTWPAPLPSGLLAFLLLVCRSSL